MELPSLSINMPCTGNRRCRQAMSLVTVGTVGADGVHIEAIAQSAGVSLRPSAGGRSGRKPHSTWFVRGRYSGSQVVHERQCDCIGGDGRY